MAVKEVVMPGLGEGVIEATVTRWLVGPGERVAEDDPLVEIATDKVDSEVVSPWNGVVKELLCEEGATVKVGAPLLRIEDGREEKEEERIAVKRVPREMLQDEKDEPKEEMKRTLHAPETGQEAAEIGKEPVGTAPARRFLSPLVRKIAQEEGISEEELALIPGSGTHGRLTKKDLFGWLARRKEHTKPEGMMASLAREKTVPAGDEDTEVIEMDRVRQLIARHMVESVRTAPHVTSFIEADVTAMVQWRERVKDAFLQREGEKLTYTPLFLEAAARVLREFPMINVSVEGTRILRKKRIHLGMATALPDGNLIVPVIRDADRKSLLGLVKEVNDLAQRARAGELKPEEIRGSTFTVTNFGTYRNLTGTPIINQPESAILGVGAILKRPAVVETPRGDAIAVRHLVILSLSYDHRIIDGALGGRFLQRLAEYLEGFDANRQI